MSVAAAILKGDADALPGRRDEAWRWTDLRSLYRVMPAPSPASDRPAANPLFSSLQAQEVLYANGRAIGPVISVLDAGAKRRLLRRFVSASPDRSHHVSCDLQVEEKTDLLLIDSFEGVASGYLSSFSGTLKVASGSRVERVVIVEDAADGVSAIRLDVELSAGADFAQTVLLGGALRQRVETRVIQGPGARLRLDGVNLIDGARHGDQTTYVTHQGLGGASDQLVKTVVAGQARAVFQGRIVVSEGADGTNARMGSHALVLSDRAEYDAKPELEIYADDVQCAHGNSVGSLDEDALFYIRTRGVPDAAARAMLTTAFVGEVVARIGDDEARALADALVSSRLGGLR